MPRRGGGDRFQQMANQRDSMSQKLIDALDGVAKAITSNGTGAGGGGGSGGGGGGGSGGGGGGGSGGGGGGPSSRSSGAQFGPDAAPFFERKENIDKLQADAHAQTMKNLGSGAPMASGLITSLGSGLATAPAFFAKAVTEASAPGFAGLDSRGNGPLGDSQAQAAMRSQFTRREAEINQEIDADKGLYRYASATGDSQGAATAARTLRQDEDRLRTVRGQEQEKLAPEEQAKARVRSQFSRAAEAGVFEGSHGEEALKLVQRSLNFQGHLAKNKAAFERKLNGMTINSNQGELGGQ